MNPISEKITRAADYLRRSEAAERTAQPGLAKLYRQAARREMRVAMLLIRKERMQSNPFLGFAYMAEDMAEAFKPIAENLNAAFAQLKKFMQDTQHDKQSNYALVGPSKGGN